MVSSIVSDWIVLFGLLMRPYKVQPARVSEDLGIMTKKKYSAIPQTPVMKPQHKVILSHVTDNRIMLYSRIYIYIYIYKYKRNIIKHNDELQWTNEHTSL